jgi:hypothetical protein
MVGQCYFQYLGTGKRHARGIKLNGPDLVVHGQGRIVVVLVPQAVVETLTVDLDGDWGRWRASEPVEVLRPERAWEGADLPVAPSIRGAADGPVNQLRDPALFEDGGRTFLFYAVAGESGIGLAEVTW